MGKISVVARDDEAVSDLARRASAAFRCSMVTCAIMAAESDRFERTVGCWLADALLAPRLGGAMRCRYWAPRQLWA